MKNFTIIIILLIGFVSHAQWNEDIAVNALVASSNSGDIKSIGTSDGQTYVVFWKAVAAPVNYELRVQLLDALGNQQFGEDGALISNTIPMSTSTSQWSLSIDDSNNIYVGVTGTSNDTGLAYKIDSSGSVLWTVTNSGAFLVKVLPLSSGETLVSWLSTATSSATMQKYDNNGIAVWPSAPAAPTPSAPANLYEISSGNYIMVYHQLGSGISSTLYAQRFDINGDAVWESPTQLANKTTAFINSYDGVQDADVVYYSYYATSSSRFDSYLQRINPDGTLPWGINGADFDTNETDYEMETKIDFNSGSDFIWSVCTYRDQSQNNSGTYVQKFDKTTGDRQFTDTAKELFAIGTDNVPAGDLQLVVDQPIFLIKSGLDNGGSPTTLNVCYLAQNGDFVWPEEMKPLATYASNKGRIQFNRPVNGQAVTVFTENRGSGSKIYAQNFIEPTLSINDINVSLSVHYLNPIQNTLTLTSSEQIQTIRVYSVLGQLTTNHSANTTRVTIASQSWKSGTYFVKVSTIHGAEKVLKIIKE